MIITTKLGALPREPEANGFSDMQGLKRDVILSSVEESLRNIKKDYLDLLYLHVDGFSVPQLEVMKTLHELVRQGIVKAIRCSNFYAWGVECERQIIRRCKLTEAIPCPAKGKNYGVPSWVSLAARRA